MSIGFFDPTAGIHFIDLWRMNSWVDLGGSKVESAVHPSEVDKMSTRNFWKLNGKK